MIEIYLRRLMLEKSEREGRRIGIKEISEVTGISRQALTKIADTEGANAETKSLDKLCTYFGCRIEELVQHVPDSNAAKPSQRARITVPALAKKKAVAAKKASR